jgi:uncharacterized protein
MSPVIYFSALILGFAGSFHCLGMCGPIALSISGRNANYPNRFFPHLLYFTGKTATYGLMGLLFGLFGQGLVLAGWQQGLSIAMGVIMLLLVLVSLFKAPWFHQNPATTWLQNKLVPVFGMLFRRQGISTSFFLGLLNGLLPCGLVYIGLTAAVATGNAVSAGLFMVVFGLGTMPVMLAFLIFTRQLSYNLRTKLRQLTPALMTIVGTILILRGLDLGIPYISPLLDSLMITSGRGAEVVPCHP